MTQFVIIMNDRVWDASRRGAVTGQRALAACRAESVDGGIDTGCVRFFGRRLFRRDAVAFNPSRRDAQRQTRPRRRPVEAAGGCRPAREPTLVVWTAAFARSLRVGTGSVTWQGTVPLSGWPQARSHRAWHRPIAQLEHEGHTARGGGGGGVGLAQMP